MAGLDELLFPLHEYKPLPGKDLQGEIWEKRNDPRTKVAVQAIATQKYFAREVDNYRRIGKHPVIIEFKGYADLISPEPKAILEYAPNGSLADMLKRVWNGETVDAWTPTFRAKAIFGSAVALMRIHDQVAAHRRFYPSCILLDKDNNVKVTGLIHARTIAAEAEMSIVEAPNTWEQYFFAPEMLDSGVYTSKVDIFAYGMLVYCLGTGKRPEIKGGGFPLTRLVDGDRPESPNDTGSALQQLITVCCESDPSNRLEATAIVQELVLNEEPLLPGVNQDEYQQYIQSCLSKEEIDRLKGTSAGHPNPVELKCAHDAYVLAPNNLTKKLTYAKLLGQSKSQQDWELAYRLLTEVPDGYGTATAFARYLQASSLMTGKGVRVNGSEAATLFEQVTLILPSGAPELHLRSESFDRLGIIHEKGIGRAKRDLNMAFEFYRRGAEEGSHKAMAHYGIMCLERAKAAAPDEANRYYTEARRLFAAASEKEAGASTYLADMMIHGEGGDQDIDGAIRLLRDAAEKDSSGAPMAMFNLGEIYARGLYGQAVDIPRAKKYYRSSVEKNNTLAAISLVNILASEVENGTAADRDANIADITNLLEWESICGVCIAVRHAAAFFWSGRLGISRPHEALEMLARVSRQSPEACRQLAQMLREGKGDAIPPDPEQAEAYESHAKELEKRRRK